MDKIMDKITERILKLEDRVKSLESQTLKLAIALGIVILAMLAIGIIK
jgi:hypothetical protein